MPTYYLVDVDSLKRGIFIILDPDAVFNDAEDVMIQDIYDAIINKIDYYTIQENSINYTLPQLKCNSCGYSWYPRVPHPAVCPKCHSRIWNKIMKEG